MTILPDTDSPVLILLIGASISIGIASGVAYETIYRLRKHRLDAGDDADKAAGEQTQMLQQWLLHQQQQEVQEHQQVMLDAVLDLNKQLTEAYRDMALLKIEMEKLRQPDDTP